MSNGQINIRIDVNLKRDFQIETKKRGLDTTKLLTSWIKTFVRGENVLTTFNSPTSNEFQLESEKLEKQISCLNQKVKQLEETIVILSLIQYQFLTPCFEAEDRHPNADCDINKKCDNSSCNS